MADMRDVIEKVMLAESKAKAEIDGAERKAREIVERARAAARLDGNKKREEARSQARQIIDDAERRTTEASNKAVEDYAELLRNKVQFSPEAKQDAVNTILAAVTGAVLEGA